MASGMLFIAIAGALRMSQDIHSVPDSFSFEDHHIAAEIEKDDGAGQPHFVDLRDLTSPDFRRSSGSLLDGARRTSLV